MNIICNRCNYPEPVTCGYNPCPTCKRPGRICVRITDNDIKENKRLLGWYAWQNFGYGIVSPKRNENEDWFIGANI